MNSENRNYKILVVDDDQGALLYIEHLLSRNGYDVITVDGGDLAMKMIQQSVPDMLITDIVMDNGEGTGLIIELKKMSNIPVLAISGGNIGFGTDYLQMAMQLGANATLSKPFFKSELLDKVKEFLG